MSITPGAADLGAMLQSLRGCRENWNQAAAQTARPFPAVWWALHWLNPRLHVDDFESMENSQWMELAAGVSSSSVELEITGSNLCLTEAALLSRSGGDPGEWPAPPLVPRLGGVGKGFGSGDFGNQLTALSEWLVPRKRGIEEVSATAAGGQEAGLRKSQFTQAVERERDTGGRAAAIRKCP